MVAKLFLYLSVCIVSRHAIAILPSFFLILISNGFFPNIRPNLLSLLYLENKVVVICRDYFKKTCAFCLYFFL